MIMGSMPPIVELSQVLTMIIMKNFMTCGYLPLIIINNRLNAILVKWKDLILSA